MKHQTITLQVSSDDETDMRRAIELACDYLTQHSEDIEVSDVDIEDIVDDNPMGLAETDGETEASRNV